MSGIGADPGLDLLGRILLIVGPGGQQGAASIQRARPTSRQPERAPGSRIGSGLSGRPPPAVRAVKPHGIISEEGSKVTQRPDKCRCICEE